MPRVRNHRLASRLLPGAAVALAVFIVGGIVVNLVSERVSPWIAPLSSWVVVPIGIALLATLGALGHRRSSAARVARTTRPVPSVHPRFADRETELDWLKQGLPRAGREQPIVQVVHGLSGVGKSQIAAKHLRDHVDAVIWWWVPRDALFEQFTLDGVRQLFDDVSVSWPEAASLDDRVEVVRSMFEQTEHPWLLLIDDVDGWDAQLHRVVPQRGPGQVVITSTNSHWTQPPGVRALEIGPIELWRAASWLERRTGRTDQAGSLAVARRLGGLPLALEQAAAYLLMNSKVSFAAYCRELDIEPEPSLDGRLFTPDDHQLSVWRTWRPAMARCAEERPASPSVMATLSMLADAEVPIAVLAAGLTPRWKPNAVRQAIDELVRNSLLSRAGDGVRMHVLVGDVTRDTCSRAELDDAAATALAVAVALLDGGHGDAFVVPHAEAVIIREAARRSTDGSAAPVSVDLLRIAAVAAEHRTSQEPLRRIDVLRSAIAIRDASPTSAPEEWRKALADTLVDVAIEDELHGDFDRALDHYHDSLGIYRALGDQQGEATSLHGIAEAERCRGNYDTAVLRYGEAITTCRAIGDQGGAAESLHGLAEVERYRGNLAAAMDRYDETLTICRALGDQDGEADALYGIADIERVRGSLDRAIRFYDEALALYRALGDRPAESSTLWGIAGVEAHRGDHDAAFARYGEALAIAREIGSKDREAYARLGMAMLERDRGDRVAALDHGTEALTLFRSTGHKLGEINALQELARAERVLGRLDRAISLDDEALALCRAIGDPGGEATSLHGIAETARLRGDHRLAIEHYHEALALFRAAGNEGGEALVLTGIERAERGLRGEPD